MSLDRVDLDEREAIRELFEQLIDVALRLLRAGPVRRDQDVTALLFLLGALGIEMALDSYRVVGDLSKVRWSRGVENRRSRLYRGFCRPELVQATLASLFNAQKDALWDLYMSFELLEENRREDAVKYYEDFYEMLDDEGDFEDDILDACRNLPG